MTDGTAFTGFTKETVRFFTALRRNNNRGWFEKNRPVYETHVMAPARLFVVAMGAKMKTLAPGVIAVPQVNKSIFRINRDTRFSLDPSPYKANLGILFWDGVRPKMESSGFYFHLEPPDLWLGAGMYMIPDPLLGRFRKAVVDGQSGAEIGKIVAAIRATPGYSVDGSHYKRLPAGFDPGPYASSGANIYQAHATGTTIYGMCSCFRLGWMGSEREETIILLTLSNMGPSLHERTARYHGGKSGSRTQLGAVRQGAGVDARGRCFRGADPNQTATGAARSL